MNEGGEVLTAGELCAALRQLPQELPVLLCIDRDVTVRNAVNERVDGRLEDSFAVEVLDLSETFSLGKGWHTAVCLFAERDI